MIDRKQLREALTPDVIIKLMKLLGATEFEDRGNYIMFKTICHNIHEEEAGFNLSYYKDSYRFFCFSNCHSMDIFDLIKRRWKILEKQEDMHFESLAYWVMNHSLIDLDECTPQEEFRNPIDARKYKNVTTEMVLPQKNEKVLESFSKHHCIEWLEDGISDAAMDKYNIRYSIARNAIIIPHYDVNGRLVGIRRRALDQEEAAEAKYKPIFIEGVNYSHPLGYNIYGLDKIIPEVKRRGKIYIAEGEKSCLQGYTAWGDNNLVAAVCGNKINRWQINIIMKYCNPNEIIIAFDKGLDYDKIYQMCKKYSGYCNFSFLCDKDDLLKDKESPFDRVEIIDKLVKGRVKVT